MEFKKWSKPTKHSQVPSLPQELITEILLRLPVKPLLQFRCVSKSWLALISSPQFVKTHLRLSTSNNKDNTHHMLALSTSPTSSYEYIFQDCTVKSLLYEPVTVELEFDYPMDGLSEILFNNSIIGSVHGLICLKPQRHDLFFWNPSIKKYKKLPGCKPTLMSDASLYGFGYDEFHDDYKVVVIFSRDDNSDQVEVKIYSLKSGSWKNVDGYPGGMPFSVSGKFVNGKLHWTTLVPGINGEDNWNIISINLADEKWGKVELPSYKEGDDFVWLDVLGSDLSFFCSYLRAHTDVWVMKEYGVKESWTKMFTIKYSVDFRLIPSSFMSNTGEILVYFGSSILIYNSKDDSLRYSNVINFDRCCGAEIYVESLVCPFST